MKTLLRHLLLALPLFTFALAADDKGIDSIAGEFYSPELVLVHQQEIELRDDQRETIMAGIHELQENSPQMQSDLQDFSRELAALVKEEQPDVGAVLAQFDRVQAQETKIKRAHLELLLRIKSVLNQDQQKQLAILKQRGPSQYPPPSVQKKLDEIQAGVQEWVNAGRDPASISEMMQEFSPLIRDGKLKEANELLDRVLKTVREKKEK